MSDQGAVHPLVKALREALERAKAALANGSTWQQRADAWKICDSALRQAGEGRINEALCESHHTLGITTDYCQLSKEHRGIHMGKYFNWPEQGAGEQGVGREGRPTELDLVRLVLSAHQNAYARFHNGEGRGVIEADQMAIGYASVELAKALATPAASASQESGNVYGGSKYEQPSVAPAASAKGEQDL